MAIYDAHCRCGEVRFRVTGAPLVTMAFHCTGCQRMMASAFSLATTFLRAQAQV